MFPVIINAPLLKYKRCIDCLLHEERQIAPLIGYYAYNVNSNCYFHIPVKTIFSKLKYTDGTEFAYFLCYWVGFLCKFCFK